MSIARAHMRTIGILLLAACTMENPAFDPGRGGASAAESAATGPGGTAPTTSTSGAVTTGTSTGETGEWTSTVAVAATDAGTTTTTSEGTTLGETTREVTTEPSCPPCGQCEQCVGGACVVTPGATCAPPEGETPCDQRVYGVDLASGDCLKFAPAKGTCMDSGSCEYVCTQPGEVLIDCDSGCVSKDHNCAPQLPIEETSLKLVCITDGSKTDDGCGDACAPFGEFYHHEKRGCGMMGKCEMISTTDCQFGKCSDEAGCAGNMCGEDAQCEPPAVCKLGKCDF